MKTPMPIIGFQIFSCRWLFITEAAEWPPAFAAIALSDTPLPFSPYQITPARPRRRSAYVRLSRLFRPLRHFRQMPADFRFRHIFDAFSIFAFFLII
jgi:hypothetical protein